MEIYLNSNISKPKGTVSVKFSIGFGNNIFQYCFARILAEHHGCFFEHPYLPGFEFTEKKNSEYNNSLKRVYINQQKYITGIYSKYLKDKNPNLNYKLHGFFEDYTIYQPYLKKIRDWFPKVEKRKSNDLVIHLRLQNRLIQLSHYLNLIEPKSYEKIINQFNFDQLHIITDLEKWEKYNYLDILKIKKDVFLGPNPGAKLVKTKDSVDYINSLISALSKYNPIVHCSKSKTIRNTGGLRGGFMEAFDLLRSFDQIIIQNSTFSWWAAVLGNASKVAVYHSWKPSRKSNCPNLGKTNYRGWYSWGSDHDLLSNRPQNSKYNKFDWDKFKKRARIIRFVLKPFRFILNNFGSWSTKQYK